LSEIATYPAAVLCTLDMWVELLMA